jgi:HlyD family secretion protein
MQQVKTGIQDDEYIQILEGLEEDAEVVTDPYNMVSNRLRDKQQVKKVQKEKLYTEK